MGGIGFFPLNHDEGHLACCGVFWWNILQHITLRFRELQFIAVLFAEIKSERMWQSSRTLVHLSQAESTFTFASKLKPKNKRTIFMVDDSYVSMVSEILPCHHDLWCLWWVDFPVLLISKCCYQIYGVLKYIANISGLTAFARHSLGSCFCEGCDL